MVGEREREGRARMGKGWVYVSAARIQFFRDKRIAETGETGLYTAEGRKEGGLGRKQRFETR